jgi:nucleotide-binding universal stress UspA family protein
VVNVAEAKSPPQTHLAGTVSSEGLEPQRRPVVAAIDLSPRSEVTLISAKRAAVSLGAPLVVLHVVHDEGATSAAYMELKRQKEQLVGFDEIAAELMYDLLTRMSSEHPTLLEDLEHRLVRGLPVNRIVEVARQLDAQLIVMGSDGGGGLARRLFGSTTDRVERLSPVPVKVVED